MKITDEMIEAAAEYLYDWQTGSVGYFHSSNHKELWIHAARQALAAADAVVKRVDEAGNGHQKCLDCGRYVSECCLTLDERMARARAKGVEFVKEADAVAPEPDDHSELIAEAEGRGCPYETCTCDGRLIRRLTDALEGKN